MSNSIPEKVVEDLLQLAFHPAIDGLVRWDGDVNISVTGDYTYNLYPVISRYAKMFGAASSGRIHMDWEGKANFVVVVSLDQYIDATTKYRELYEVFMHTEEALEAEFQKIKKLQRVCRTKVNWFENGAVNALLLHVPAGAPADQIHTCIYKAFIRGLGLVNAKDLPAFDASSKVVPINTHHEELLHALFDQRLSPGMSKAEVSLALRSSQ